MNSGGHGTHVPAPLERETIYGWSARYHRLSGITDPCRTSQILFGHPRAGLRHDFPHGLEHFQDVTHELLGHLEDVVRTRTAFGFHLPFATADTGQRVLNAMVGKSRESPRRLLGLNKFGLAVPVPLKACPDCTGLQTARHRFSTWLANLQWPSVSVCPAHRCILRVACDNLHLPEVTGWILPHDLTDSNYRPLATPSLTALEQALDLARWTEAIISRPGLHLTGELLRLAYRLQAKELGWVAMDGSVRLQELRNSFDKEHRGLVLLPGLEFLSDTGGVNAGFLGLLLREYPGARHPAKHIALMRFLFREPEVFFANYEALLAADRAGELASATKKLTELRARLTNLVAEEGHSVNAACKALGVPPTQGIRFLKSAGIAYNKRPRVLDSDRQQKLESMLKAGAERKDIASALGIRKAFIKDLLAQQPELRQAWEDARWTRRSGGYRAHFLQILEANPGVPIKRIRRIPGNGFEWLYRNDTAWLINALPGIWHRPP